MHLSSIVVALGVCSGAWAAPVEQKPLAGNGHHAGPHARGNGPYNPNTRDPYDRKVDSVGDKLNPLPWVCVDCPEFLLLQRSH